MPNWRLIKKRAKNSRLNFACLVSKEIYSLEEMLGKNCRGWKKPKLDPAKLLAVQKIVIYHFPCDNKEEDLVWQLCEKAIDTMLRNETAKRLKKNNTQ
jgi:hypothetical protein